MKHTILILYRATNHWLSLTRNERKDIFEKEIQPILLRYQSSLQIEFYDSEAFHARISDFIKVESTDLKQYYFFIEELRDTAFFSVPYIELQDIVMGIQNGFVQFENEKNESIGK